MSGQMNLTPDGYIRYYNCYMTYISEGEESGDCEAYILKEVSTKDEEVLYQMVEDDVEFSAIAKVFSELTDDDTALEY